MRERRVRRVFTPEQKFEIAGTTRRGISGLMHLGRDWLTVREALELPEPDTSWMSIHSCGSTPPTG